ncbi:MAG: hypothetical protein MMC23_004553 [Stictis urceolatum]|nr:hypothetical protein [Stictis urceolata]
MSSGSYVKESILAFYYSHFFVPAVAALVFVAIFYATQSKDNSTIPLYLPEKSAAGNYKTRWVWDSVNLLQEAYRKFNGKPFRVWTTEGAQVVIPPDYVDELKMLPDHTFPSALRNVRKIADHSLLSV